MQVTIESVSDVKEGQYGLSSKILSGGTGYFVNCDATQYLGKLVEMDVEEKTSAKGNKYKIGKILKVIEQSKAATQNGGKTWGEYETMAKLAHGLAMELEPDGTAESASPVRVNEQFEGVALPLVIVDRSNARARILNTAMMAFTNGKISLAVAEDDIPF